MPTTAAQAALSYMEANADSYITTDSADGPGQLAILILDAHAMGADPTNFGRHQPRDSAAGHGADRRDRTQGCFGTEQQPG